MIFPKDEVVENSFVKDYEKLYAEVKTDPEAFWENIAHELKWFKQWDKVLDWQYPYARWFTGGQTNIVYNALDRHMKTSVRDKLAIIWVGQDMSERRFTYGQLNEQVCKFSNVLKTLGVRKGDRVAIYLPKIPEQIIAMLAAAKIGAVHSVVYSGFSSDALKTRIEDAQAKILVTCDGYQYKDKIIDTKKNADEAIKDLKCIEHVIIVQRMAGGVSGRAPASAQDRILSNDVKVNQRLSNEPENINKQPTDSEHLREGNSQQDPPQTRDLFWDDLMKTSDTICSTEIMEATDPLFILYTSGSTGKPKGCVHSHAGYMVGTYITMKWVFNLSPDDVFYCTADPGWITGHSYMVYSPLINGITSLIYESVPDYPHPGRWWELIEKYKVTKFYSTPTAIRALMRYGDDIPKKYDFSSLRILGSVGEPINPKAWIWFYENIGRDNYPPLMDTWWQTETGMHMITPFPSVPLKPGSCFKPFPGIEIDIVDDHGQPAPKNTQGYLVINTPWPAMLMDVYNNPKRYLETYFENEAINRRKNLEKNPSSTDQLLNSPPNQISNFSDFLYFTGDSAKIDNDGYVWIVGRNDDVIKVSGHRLGSAELEHALVEHPAVAEAAVIGKPHEVKGESIKAFVILRIGYQSSEDLKKELCVLVRKSIGPIATPDEIEFVEKLPKTRSGKIMRRVLKAQELGQPLGDTSTLEN